MSHLGRTESVEQKQASVKELSAMLRLEEENNEDKKADRRRR
jgi:hypothetical protein